MTLVVNHENNVCRLYDGNEDNPNELNVGRLSDGRLTIGLEDRDSGNNELWITVSEEELLAALALTKVAHVGQDG
jgi:hypothetical protein